MNQSKKTVVLLTPGFAENEQDTTCIPVLQDFAASLMRNYPAINLHIIAFQYPYNEESYVWNGANVYSAGGKNSKFFSRLSTWKRVVARLKKLHQEYRIDVIHSFWLTEAAFIGQRFASRRRIKHVSYLIGQDALKKNRYLRFLTLSKMKIAAMSQNLADRFLETTGYKIKIVISTGLVIQKIKCSDIPRIIDIVGVGALTELKNYGLFIDVINALKQDFPDVKAVIIGKGEQEKSLRAKIEILQLNKNVKLLGELTHDEVFKSMNKSKIFLHTSGYEGQSTVIMEALAMGLTVVCFNIGRIHVDGKIVVCNDKNEMVEQLKKLLSSQLNHAPVIVRTTDDMANDFMKLYEA